MNVEHHRLLWDLVTILHSAGVRNAVICPGSRNGPLVNAVACHPAIRSFSCVDERSAAYQALGMSEQLSQPVALVCTSGTAALNFSPAVAEAFYQHIPLIVLTADRPAEWIDQLDGQAIRQSNVYGGHTKLSVTLPEENTCPDTTWHSVRLVNEAVTSALTHPHGPVHINIPLREPLYLPPGVQPEYAGQPKIIDVTQGEPVLSGALLDKMMADARGCAKVLILGGQGARNDSLICSLSQLSTSHAVAVVGDCVSNLAGVDGLISIPDHAVSSLDANDVPDLLLTFGRSILSRRLKEFLRTRRPASHWHIGVEPAADVFQSLTRHVRVFPEYFFRVVAAGEDGSTRSSAYRNDLAAKVNFARSEYVTVNRVPGKFTEFSAVARLLDVLPDGEVLHLGNSLAVRHVDAAGVPSRLREVFANRGASGIDGSVSTALGHAIAAPDRRHTLLVGDLGLMYDINGLWREAIPANLRIVVLNNHGGRIFSSINGPGNNPRTLPFFTTPHTRSAGPIAAMFGLDYLRAGSWEDLEKAFTTLSAPREKALVLELDFS